MALPAGIAKILKCLHHPLDVTLRCVWWYVAYPLKLTTQVDHRVLAIGHGTTLRGDSTDSLKMGDLNEFVAVANRQLGGVV